MTGVKPPRPGAWATIVVDPGIDQLVGGADTAEGLAQRCRRSGHTRGARRLGTVRHPVVRLRLEQAVHEVRLWRE